MKYGYDQNSTLRNLSMKDTTTSRKKEFETDNSNMRSNIVIEETARMDIDDENRFKNEENA
ncbi:hypothetical protein HJC23_010120 [Cyclotella cryptica]|uniref:Uncharacterized protein n=1 Tax=Cyclotella cryptica TaxID=29204 RepID=A0ABD3P546_9STRA